LGYATGQVSFLPAGATDWVQAELNRPLWVGDRLWTAADARAELQMGSSALRVAPETSVSIIAFDDRREQYEVTQGTVRLRVRSMDRDDAIEIDTPNLAFSIRSPGDYRVDVDADTTTVAVIRGSADAYGTQNAYAISAGRAVRFSGTDLGDYQAVGFARADPFDRWVGERIAFEERSTSARYVSADMIGYADLDAHGSWRQVPSYGSVWVPTDVAPDWAPYRYGRWLWLDPWGWTWVDDAPWGFAPFHYGRWAFVDSRWCWVPGPRTVRPVYAPALVAFVGGPNIGVSVALGAAAGVAWFPLGPGEVYRPAYSTSRDYFTRVNVTNTVVNVTQVTNIYNNPTRVDVRYANVERSNAVTAVPTQAFVGAQPVQRAAVKIDRQALQRAPVVAAPAQVAPVKASFVGAAPPAQAQPAPAVTGRMVIAKTAPPAPPPSIEQRQQMLQRQPGKPLDQAELQRLAPPANAARQNVKVVQPGAPSKPLPATAAEKEASPQTARLQNEPAQPTPPRAEQRQKGERETPQAPAGARPGAEGRAQPAPPAPEAQPRTPAPAPRATESQRPPQTAIARPEATQRPSAPAAKGREPIQRPQGAPETEQERATPPQAAPAQPSALRPEMSKASPRAQPQAAPPPRPETANVPPRPVTRDASESPRQQAAPPPPRESPRPQVATPSPREPARQQAAPPAARESMRQQPAPPPRESPQQQAAPPPPRESPRQQAAPPPPRESPRQQAAAPPPRAPEGRPAPTATPRQAEQAPPPRGGDKGKGKDNEKDKDENK
jgi:hypothetical protein